MTHVLYLLPVDYGTRVLATMDEYATDWTQTDGPDKPDQ